mgnify:CR=1 FL=1
MVNAVATGGGRALIAFMTRITGEIESGLYQRGGFLPSTRALGERFDISPETARRGLKLLEGQGLLNSAGRAGFRVADRRKDEGRTSRPIAFVSRWSPTRPESQLTLNALFLAFQEAGARQGWPFLGAYGGEGGVEAIVDQLRAGNAWGAVLDTIDAELHEAISRCGLPAVMVNSWDEGSPLSAVLQDNYRGGFLAAEHLIERGAKTIGWVGPVSEFCHPRERFAGASARLRAASIHIADRDCVAADDAGIGAMLAREDRPEGILAFGENGPAVVKRVADRLGLTIGRDFELVWWAAEECWEQLAYRAFGGALPPPAVVWSARTMVKRAMSLLAESGDGPVGETVRICVSTKLRFGASPASPR